LSMQCICVCVRERLVFGLVVCGTLLAKLWLIDLSSFPSLDR